MTRRLLVVAMTAATLATMGCTTIPEIDPDGCGNLVLNADEDCDGFGNGEDNTVCGAADSENACFFLCDDDGGSVVCPSGWGCGADGRCRRPSAIFEPGPGSPYRFRVSDFEIGDIDGDGFNDLVGNDDQTVTVRFGSETGELADELDVLTRRPFGRLAYGYFDDDKLLDVMVPVAAGLFVLLGSEDRELDPVAYSPLEIPVTSGQARVVPVESDGGDNFNTELVMAVGGEIEFISSKADSMILPTACSGARCLATDIVGNIPVGDVDNDPDGRMEFALAFRQAGEIYVYTSVGANDEIGATLSVSLLATVSLLGGARIDQGAFIADADGDGENDLIISVRTAANSPRIAVAIGDGAGNFGSPIIRPVYGRGVAGDSAWPLAVGNFAGDAKADYVFTDSIRVSDLGVVGADGITGIPAVLVPTQFVTNASWTEAALGDFNGDLSIDVTTVIEGAEGVDVFLNAYTTGIFNKFHIDTEDPPRNLRVADYDGDFVADIAFVESGLTAAPDALSVIFGAVSGGPSEPVPMGELGFIEILEPISSVASVESLDVIADLFLLTSSFPDRTTTSVAVLQGSSSRRMLSPFTLIPGLDKDPDFPRAALFGNFSATSDGIKDVVAVASVGFDRADVGGVELELVSHLWFVPGAGGDGQLDAGGAGFVTLPESSTFDTSCAVWTSGEIDGTEPEEIVAIDNSVRCYGGGFSPAPRLFVGNIVGGSGDPFGTNIETLDTQGRAVSQIELRDLDGDGDNDLLALFSGEILAGGDGAISGAQVVVLWNIDGALSMANASSLSFSGRTELYDVDVIQLDDTGVPGLAILADLGVYVATLDPETKAYSAPNLLFAQFGDGRLEVGDLNADGLEDIAYTVGDDVHVFLAKVGATLGATVSDPAPTEQGGDQ